MSETQSYGLQLVQEDEASDEVKALYEAFKRDFQLPSVPNYIMAIGLSPETLQFYFDMMRSFYGNLTLPQSLISMISFAIAKEAECEYCSATQELTCRTLGVDEDTLNTIVENLSELNPERVRAIIKFATKVAKYPQSLVPADYDNLRKQGVANHEIVQIVNIASVSVYLDIMADALKIELDPYLVTS